MNHFFALSPNELKRISYHWFWGLALDRQGYRTFYEDAILLSNNPVLQKQFMQQLIAINTLPWWLRGLYWIFNSNNCRTNYYKVYSMLSFKLYTKLIQSQQYNNTAIDGFAVPLELLSSENNMLNQIASYFNQSSVPNAASVISNIQRIFYTPTVETITHMMNWRFKEEDIDNTSDTEVLSSDLHCITSSSPNNNQKKNTASETICVTTIMLPHLHTLGLTTLNIGNEFTLEQLKKTYHQFARDNHPDKCKNNPAAATNFAAGNNAYTLLLNIIQRSTNENPAPLNMSGFFSKKFLDELDKLIKLAKEAAIMSDKRAEQNLNSSEVQNDDIEQTLLQATWNTEQAEQRTKNSEKRYEEAKRQREKAELEAEEATKQRVEAQKRSEKAQQEAEEATKQRVKAQQQAQEAEKGVKQSEQQYEEIMKYLETLNLSIHRKNQNNIELTLIRASDFKHDPYSTLLLFYIFLTRIILNYRALTSEINNTNNPKNHQVIFDPLLRDYLQSHHNQTTNNKRQLTTLPIENPSKNINCILIKLPNRDVTDDLGDVDDSDNVDDLDNVDDVDISKTWVDSMNP